VEKPTLAVPEEEALLVTESQEALETAVQEQPAGETTPMAAGPPAEGTEAEGESSE
jgi:hypothetical protein